MAPRCDDGDNQQHGVVYICDTRRGVVVSHLGEGGGGGATRVSVVDRCWRLRACVGVCYSALRLRSVGVQY